MYLNHYNWVTGSTMMLIKENKTKISIKIVNRIQYVSALAGDGWISGKKYRLLCNTKQNVKYIKGTYNYVWMWACRQIGVDSRVWNYECVFANLSFASLNMTYKRYVILTIKSFKLRKNTTWCEKFATKSIIKCLISLFLELIIKRQEKRRF